MEHMVADERVHQAIAEDVLIGRQVRISKFVNLYGCRIGDHSMIGSFVEIQRNVVVGARCKIESHSFLCEGVVLGNGVFVGHGVTFTNDLFPRAINADGSVRGDDDWELLPTVVKEGASIGSGATILPGVTIGEFSLVGAGSTVVKDVPARTIVAGNPARIIRRIDHGK